MTVYWPRDGIQKRDGTLIGFRQGSIDIVVASVDIRVDLDNCLALLNDESQGHGRSKGAVKVLGRAHESSAPTSVTQGSSRELDISVDQRGMPTPRGDRSSYILYGSSTGHNGLQQLKLKESHSIGGSLSRQEEWSRRSKGTSSQSTADDENLSDLQLDSCRALRTLLSDSRANEIPGIQDRQDCPSIPSSPFGAMQTASAKAMSFLVSHSATLLWQSATFRQTLIRLDHLRVISDLSSSQIQLLYSMCLAVDILLGLAARHLINAHTTTLHELMKRAFSTYMIDWVDHALGWLNDWPAGLKLNTPLSDFFRTNLGMIIRTWGELFSPHMDRISSVILNQLLPRISTLGLTLALAVVHDALLLSSLHLRLCWNLTRWICLWQLESLSGLWNLFRGKRWNMLRKRTDSYEYDVDQLFVGTLFFTVSIFLLPTVVVYTALFGLVMCVVKATQRAMDVVVLCSVRGPARASG
ncbi:N-acetylglucosaminyl transferase component-domain-containing protein [Kockovaella imperatae]|uniref:N-acetylglucosaminyl transferase component-domain-containing protein n=1 Tax=Kockovaella imperatae TaxID=4999 RepID=A0A1Y1UB69_9TREE|nr:N-acetylglucosaminyl transferase component-domain-containing protein [Kockovaella imperatae]ORX35281.1 N-acetylglucosaminyl transferase component-domain-containing protein [Kockovaella imperatae]